ncbi:ATP-binding protein [Flagellimonas pacifica]|uniref:ATP-dependent DNA helicase RecG n=1 Tax=Flagellimonas pacifica TaxID=1247520 RepID=A0A285MVH0_9FLAO|nr:ATP-binding protein [Allomuricauda parva]SNZ01189.1 ATP-dependent DNA helicase RecG [Allomuricauda parva]
MPEQQNIEWKQSWRDEYLQWVSGFANADGGAIYIGKNDNGDVVGLSNYKKLLDELPNKIRDTTGIVCQVNLLDEDGKFFIEILVDPFSSPVSYRGKFYLRSGSTNQLLNGASLEDFILKKGNLSWDEVTVPNATMDDIDLNAIESFKNSTIKTGRIPSIKESTTDDFILKNLGLIDDNGTLNRAAILLFGKEPTKYFTSAYLKIGKFGDSPTELLSQDVIESNAFELADATIEVLNNKYIVRDISYDGLQRIETPEYPFEALREALFNAIVHRSYQVTPITIRIYDDRIAIWNIGELPEQLSAEDLKKEHGSYPRNKLLANAFYKGGHIESWGRGTLKIIEECKKHGLVEPLIHEHGGGLSVTIFKDIYNEKYLSKLDLNDRQKIAIKAVKKAGHITNLEYRALFDITDRTVLRDVDELIKLSIFKKEGEGRATKYVIDISGYTL